MKDLLIGIILLLIGVFIGILLNVKFSIDFGLSDLFGNGITSGFNNTIKAPSNMMNEAGSMMGF